ncbi:hypothetical protein FRC08_001127 [Ceratobasidium sp. 394]|nr:hypothetical protein FRC08_001127 [Ceratobasidium sp. 394]
MQETAAPKAARISDLDHGIALEGEGPPARGQGRTAQQEIVRNAGVSGDGCSDGGGGGDVAAELPDADGGEEKDGAAVHLVHAVSAFLTGAHHVPLQACARRRGVVAGQAPVQGDAVHAGEEGRQTAVEQDAVLQMLVADGT